MKPSLVTAAATSLAIALGATVFSAQDLRTLSPGAHPVWESCEEMHDMYVTRFASAPGFGRSRMLQAPMLDRSGELDLGQSRYSLESIELVGLINRVTPVVYVPPLHTSGFNPAITDSRSLTDFESKSLAAFRSGRGIASTDDSKPGTVHCIGALRAMDTCVTCHKATKVGDLLGAFTYALQPLPPK